MKRKRRLVFGVGINDADYVLSKYEGTGVYYKNGQEKRKIIWWCPYSTKWKTMIQRCYSEAEVKRRPSYKGCTVCEEWLTFSNFKAWMETQDWEGKELDKDLLFINNREYSPDKCIFVAKVVNSFLTDRRRGRGNSLVGASWHNRDKIYQGRCNHPYTNNCIHLGNFDSELEAHLSWKKKKHELACMLAESEHVDDSRVEKALKARYSNYHILEDHLT